VGVLAPSPWELGASKGWGRERASLSLEKLTSDEANLMPAKQAGFAGLGAWMAAQDRAICPPIEPRTAANREAQKESPAEAGLMRKRMRSYNAVARILRAAALLVPR
jgi:hypothetical protein